MSAAIQSFKLLPGYSTQESAEEVQRQEVFSPRSAPDPQLQCALDYISHLEDEVSALREQLRSAERLVAHKAQLLSNSLVRERALRAELIKGVF